MFILDDVPWLRPFVSWSVALTLAWLVLSVPAFFLARALSHLLGAVWRWRTLQADARAERAERRRQRLDELTRQVVQSAGLRTLDTTVYSAWRAPFDTTLATIAKSTDDQRTLDRSAREGIQRINEAVDSLSSIHAAFAGTTDAQGKTDLVSGSYHYWRSVVTLFVKLVLLVGVLSINAILSSLVFKDLLPSVPTLFGRALPIQYIVAVLLAMAEAGVGFMHGAAAHRDDGDERRLSIQGMSLAALGCVVVFIETFFYSVFAGGASDQSTVLVFGFPVGLGFGFSLIGLVLGAMLFFLASSAYGDFVSMLRYRTAKRALSHLRELTKKGQAWQRVLDELRVAQEDAKSSLSGLAGIVEPTIGRLVEQGSALRDMLFRERESPPAWVKASTRPYTDDEVRAVFAETQLTAALAAFACASMLALTGFGLRTELWRLPWAIALCGALGGVVAMLAFGHLWGRRDRQEASSDQMSSRSGATGRWWVAGLLGLVSAWLLGVGLFVEVLLARWALGLGLIAGLVIVLTQRQNAKVPGFMRPILMSWVDAAYKLLSLLVHTVVGACGLVLELAVALLRIVGRPFEWFASIFERRQQVNA